MCFVRVKKAGKSMWLGLFKFLRNGIGKASVQPGHAAKNMLLNK